ncbi:MAG: type II toxin-antitoxin system death-on-curing family toxin [Pyrinomonadaceae bacterium]
MQYLTYVEAVKFHILYMRAVGETRIGVFDKNLVESALARPRHAFEFENADIFRQAATLLFGLIKNHPWQGGNKRTATFLTNLFLKRNGYKLSAEIRDLIDLCLKIEADVWKVEEIEVWMRENAKSV